MKNFYLRYTSIADSSSCRRRRIHHRDAQSKNGENQVFSEKFTKVAKCDTVTFKATKPGHNAEFIPGGFPQGAEELKGQVGKDVAYTFSAPGIYLIRCAPHYGMGMVAVIEVDAPSNLDQIKQVYLPGKVRAVVDEQL